MTDFVLTAEPSKHNRGSTPEVESDEWRTPLKVFRAIERHLGVTFIADMAATKDNALCPTYFTKEDDTLSMLAGAIEVRLIDGGMRPKNFKQALWCNPPYGSTGLEPWIQQAFLCSMGFGIPWVFLLPASRSEQDWLYVCKPEDYRVDFLKRRVPFLKADGMPGKSPNHPSFSITFPGWNDDLKGGTFGHLDWRK